MKTPEQWATGTGQWRRWTTIVLANPEFRWKASQRAANEIVVWTPLDLIRALEHEDNAIVTVVLTGRAASDQDLVGFLRESYPTTALVLDGGLDDARPAPAAMQAAASV